MLKKMRFSLFLRTIRGPLSLLFLLAFALAAVRAQSPAISLTPAVVVAGSPELIRVVAANAAAIDGEWLDRKLEFFRGLNGHGWFALAGGDVDAPVGRSALKITIHGAKGGTHALSRTIRIRPAHYPTSSLTVAPQFVQPGPEALKQIAADQRSEERRVGQERR